MGGDVGGTTLKVLSHHFAHGAKAGAAGKVTGKLVSTARDAFGDSYPAVLDSEIGKLVEPLLVAAGLHYLTERLGGHLPKEFTDRVLRVCEFSMESSGHESAKKLWEKIEPHLHDLQNIQLPDEVAELEQEPEPRRLAKGQQRRADAAKAKSQVNGEAVHAVPGGNT